MRGSVRQLLLALLTATCAVLWTCGSAWHVATCTNCNHPDDSSVCCNVEQKCSASCGPHSGTRHCSHARQHCHGHDNVVPASSSNEKDGTPETPHDSRSCEICQLFAQLLVIVAVSSVEVSLELVEISVCSIPLAIPECEQIPAASRGPPAV